MKSFPGCNSNKTWEETLHVKSVFPAVSNGLAQEAREVFLSKSFGKADLT